MNPIFTALLIFGGLLQVGADLVVICDRLGISARIEKALKRRARQRAWLREVSASLREAHRG